MNESPNKDKRSLSHIHPGLISLCQRNNVHGHATVPQHRATPSTHETPAAATRTSIPLACVLALTLLLPPCHLSSIIPSGFRAFSHTESAFFFRKSEYSCW